MQYEIDCMGFRLFRMYTVVKDLRPSQVCRYKHVEQFVSHNER